MVCSFSSHKAQENKMCLVKRFQGNKASEVTVTLNTTVNMAERTTREHTWIVVKCIFHAGEDRFGTALLGVHV